MASVNPGYAESAEITPLPPANRSRRGDQAAKRLHRIATVRRQQGVSLRSASRQLHVDTQMVQNQEDESSDLRLSELYRWEAILGVPVCELLMDSGQELSRPVMERARLVRVMKTVKSLMETATAPGIRRLTETLMQQLIEIMPELRDVSPWHSVGQRRSLTEYGRAAERVFKVEPSDEDHWDT